MIRLPLIAAISTSALLALATPATAQAPAGYYVATPVAAPAKPRLMTRMTPWTLRGPAYVAAKSPERPGILCELVAREAGTLSSFVANGTPLAEDALAKCNTHAKPGDAQTAAR